MDFLKDVLGIIPVWFVWVVAVGGALFWYLTKKHDYWKKVGIPYIAPLPVLGTMGQLFCKPMHDVEEKRYLEKGRIYGSYEGSRPTLIIADPDVLRDIFVKDFQFFTGRRIVNTGNPLADKMVQNLQAEDWKRVRATLTPAFTTGKIKKMTSIFIDSAKTLAENFKKAAEEETPVDVKKFFSAFTMDVIASSAFGTKIDTYNDPANPFVVSGRAVFARSVPWRAILFFLFPWVIRFFKISVFNPKSLDFFEAVTLKIMAERKRSGRKRNDLLQLLMDSAEEEFGKDAFVEEKDSVKEMGHEEGNDQIFKPYYSTKKLSNEEIIAQCIIFFLAGFETTASTLAFTAYELALNPDVQDRLIAEIDGVVKEKGELSYEALNEMKYLDCVISETLRKYPPAVRAERRCEEEYEIKGYDVTVPEGMIVGIPIYAIHHDPKHYPNPKKYDPDRFTPEQKATRHPYTYLPFGAGPRNCIGMRFALMEIRVCLTYLLSQYRFSKCSETRVPPAYFRGQGLMQVKELVIKVEKRKDGKVL